MKSCFVDVFRRVIYECPRRYFKHCHWTIVSFNQILFIDYQRRWLKTMKIDEKLISLKIVRSISVEHYALSISITTSKFWSSRICLLTSLKISHLDLVTMVAFYFVRICLIIEWSHGCRWLTATWAACAELHSVNFLFKRQYRKFLFLFRFCSIVTQSF